MGDVVVVASINVDLVVSTDRLPAPGETVTGGTFARHHGGKGANQAVAAARWGAQVHVVGAVGDDDLGRDAVAALAGDGIDTRHVARRQGTPTGVALVTVDRDGENQIAVAPGANRHVDTDGLAEVLEARGGRGVLLTGFEVPDTAVRHALVTGRAAGWIVVVDPAPARDLGGALRGSGAVLTPNRGELTAIAGEGEVADVARGLASDTAGPVVVTLGGDGALVAQPDGATTPLSAPTVTPRDTTGAGDTFAGVLAAELAAGTALVDAARAAVAAAAVATTATGARTGMPTRAGVADQLGPRP